MVGASYFAYHQTCTGDASPVPLKVVMVEGTQLYAISGTSRIDLGGGKQTGGESEADPAMRGVPLFQLHAERVWDDVVDLTPWAQQPSEALSAAADPIPPSRAE